MGNFEQIAEALFYIDGHLEEQLSLETLARQCHFSQYYFHRVFTLIVGQPLAGYIRERRLLHACVQLSESSLPVTEIGLASGFQSAQAFSRAFKLSYGLSPSAYRRQGLVPSVLTLKELTQKLTNRLKGGLYVHPNIITRGRLLIAGLSGDGNRTAEAWNGFEAMHKNGPLPNQTDENSYELRICHEGISTVHVGVAVKDKEVPHGYTVFELPTSKYASFDVYVENGYESENQAMNTWLETNAEGYRERLLTCAQFSGGNYCVEYYDHRFQGSEAGSIVEIWIPITKEG